MKTELVVALISGSISVLTAGGAIWSSLRGNANAAAIEELKLEYSKRSEIERREREVSRYKEPLLRAAYDLQSRIYNILRQGFLDVYLKGGDAREKSYAVENTIFVIAQYFCWSETFRREVQFTDLDDHLGAKNLIDHQDQISSLWASDGMPRSLRVFAGEQRAIGEALLKGSSKGLECMGYGEFLKTFQPGQDRLIDALRADIDVPPGQIIQAQDRLKAIQHALIDLLAILDPKFSRFSERNRSKIL